MSRILSRKHVILSPFLKFFVIHLLERRQGATITALSLFDQILAAMSLVSCDIGWSPSLLRPTQCRPSFQTETCWNDISLLQTRITDFTSGVFRAHVSSYHFIKSFISSLYWSNYTQINKNNYFWIQAPVGIVPFPPPGLKKYHKICIYLTLRPHGPSLMLEADSIRFSSWYMTQKHFNHVLIIWHYAEWS